MIWRGHLWLPLAFIGFLTAPWHSCLAQDRPPDPRITKVFSDWEKRQTNVASIRYNIRGERVLTKGSTTDNYGKPLKPPTPANDISFPFKRSYLFDFSTGRFRIESWEQHSAKAGQFYARVRNVAFNGSVLKNAFPRDANTNDVFSYPPESPDVTIFAGNLSGYRFENEYLPLFFAHGIVPTIEQQITAGRFNQKLNSSYFHVHGTGVYGGRPCLVLRTETLQLTSKTFDEFWVDQGRQSAVVRYVCFSANRPSSDTIIQYRNTGQNWLPKAWTMTLYNGDRTHWIYRASVEELLLDPGLSDADFDIEIKPGMRVREARFPDSPNPLFVPEPETKDYVQSESLRPTQLMDGPGMLGWSRWLWVLTGLSAVTGVIGYMVFRRRKVKPGS
jgi:hypothetical protein